LSFKINGLVKSPISALRYIARHCSVLICTPHSSRFARLELGAFYIAVINSTFYEIINLKGDFLMKNVEMTVEGEALIIKVDLSKDFGPSKSGKTIIIASTEGNVSVPERVEKIGLNVYRYPD